MAHAQEASSFLHSIGNPRSCPVPHERVGHQKTNPLVELSSPAVVCDAEGTWHIRGFEEARTILRSKDTRQAGFQADQITSMPGLYNKPILYQEGKTHQQQRKQTAQFFTPKTVSSSYRVFIEDLSDRLVERIRHGRTVDLSRLSLVLAVQVAARVVGLTNSRVPGMEKRLDVFFQETAEAEAMKGQGRWEKRLRQLRSIMRQRHMLTFFFLDVQPAIEARKRHPEQDVISHLLEQNYSAPEILTECVTYGAAGMVTTREFISLAAWHLLEQPELRARYLVAPEEERFEILHEALRLEPVVGHLYRRATAPIELESQGRRYTIPTDALIHLHVYAANADESVVGEEPLALCPGRSIQGERIPSMLMSFGDGAHRCPGSYLAIQETDIFLQRLLALDNLRIERPPTLTWNEISTGYELRNFQVTLN